MGRLLLLGTPELALTCRLPPSMPRMALVRVIMKELLIFISTTLVVGVWIQSRMATIDGQNWTRNTCQTRNERMKNK